jgi:hypothetical protein
MSFNLFDRATRIACDESLGFMTQLQESAGSHSFGAVLVCCARSIQRFAGSCVIACRMRFDGNSHVIQSFRARLVTFQDIV